MRLSFVHSSRLGCRVAFQGHGVLLRGLSLKLTPASATLGEVEILQFGTSRARTLLSGLGSRGNAGGNRYIRAHISIW